MRTRNNNHDDVPESSQQGGSDTPTLARAIAALFAGQEELLREIARNTANHGNRREAPQNQPRQCTYSDFLATHPPTFERAKEPLDADNWLRVTESKFGLLQCTEQQKALFAAHQLLGPASAWWANYQASLVAGHQVTWTEFRAAFRDHFIPDGLMKRKLQEFLGLQQGGRSVISYVETFNHLARYAGHYVDTEEKKRAEFRRGMNAKLRERLTWQTTGSFNDLVNAAIVQEDAMRQAEEEDRKRKAPMSAPSGQPSKYRLVYTSPKAPMNIQPSIRNAIFLQSVCLAFSPIR